jgi:predicted nucleic-acid-binding protein
VIGIDTNVIVRYIMQDDARQSVLATRFMESLTQAAPGFLSHVALVEMVWVLSSAYGLSRAEVTQVLEHLLQTKEVVVERADVVARAVRQFKASTADLADCLIAGVGQQAGCDHTVTFDKGAAKSAGMQLLSATSVA